MIPKAYNETDSTIIFSEANRDKLKCKEDYFKIDKYGFCCEPAQLYDPKTEIYPEPATTCPLTECVCKPIQNLDKSLVKENMSNNGEFVARLDNAMRYKLVSLGSLEKCISSARAIPEKYNFNILKPNDSVKYTKSISVDITLIELKRAVDPLGNYELVKHLGKEMHEWIEMFYSPCIAALYGMNVGTTPNTDVSYFMAYPWHTHDECMKLSCLTNGMRWDRTNGGCIPSLVTGTAAPGYTGDNAKCALDVDTYGDSQACKYDTTTLDTFRSEAQTCWSNTQVISAIDYIIIQYCNPKISKRKVSDGVKSDLETKMNTHCKGVTTYEIYQITL